MQAFQYIQECIEGCFEGDGFPSLSSSLAIRSACLHNYLLRTGSYGPVHRLVFLAHENKPSKELCAWLCGTLQLLQLRELPVHSVILQVCARRAIIARHAIRHLLVLPETGTRSLSAAAWGDGESSTETPSWDLPILMQPIFCSVIF